MTHALEGGWLCGGVRYACDAEPVLTALFHGQHYQKQTSATYSIVEPVPMGRLIIERGTLKASAGTGDNRQPLERSFCLDCGSPIRSFVAALPDLEFIKAETLDDTSWPAPTMEPVAIGRRSGSHPTWRGN